MEPTLNNKGHTYHNIGVSEQAWLSSLPTSPLPLLDVGACYGVQTMYALALHRDVISIDLCEQHITELRRRVARIQQPAGRLVDAIVAELPDSHVIPHESVAGILCSEVLHFLKPGMLRPLFHDFYRWLAPGGKLVITAAAWPPRVRSLVEQGMTLSEGRSVDDVLGMLKHLPKGELVDCAPGMMWLPKKALPTSKVGEFMYLLSKEELREVSQFAGFVLEDVRYYDSQKRGTQRPSSDAETVLLVVRKPCEQLDQG